MPNRKKEIRRLISASTIEILPKPFTVNRLVRIGTDRIDRIYEINLAAT
jgi:hypothetical protein